MWTPYCGAAPLPSDWLARWNLDPVLLAVLALLPFIFFRCRAGGTRDVPAFWAAWSMAVLLFVSPLCALTSALFSARVTHHVLLTAVIAPLLAAILPRLPERWGSLALWTGAHALVFWMWHSPALYAAALASDAVFWTMQLTLLGSAVGLWLAIRSTEPIWAVTALLATMVQMGLLGALLTFARAPLYIPHLAATGPWGLSPTEDQQLAGLIMWAPGAGLYLAAAAILLARWLSREQRGSAAA
jgi:putative membrane protein